ncbi:MAG: hypothetical protein OXK17_08475 [Thaumarchaeota archaeon]|nr:hypothetical protein [Nitrososphaerota archaeon]
MGFCYSDGLLCCDFCGKTRRGGSTRILRSDTPKRGYHPVVRRDGHEWTLYTDKVLPDDTVLRYERSVAFEVRCIRCPYNWCQKWAVCTDCRLEGRHRYASCINTRKGDGNTHQKICKEASRLHNEGKTFPEIRERVAVLARVAA